MTARPFHHHHEHQQPITMTQEEISTKIRVMVRRLRMWLISKLLTDDEKRLIAMAIDDRVDSMNRAARSYKWVDQEQIVSDIRDYVAIRKIMSTSDWG